MNGYHFLQLDNAHRRIYNTLYEGVQQYKTTFDFGTETFADINLAYAALVKDNPQFFWLSGDSQCTVTKTNGRQTSLEYRATLYPGIHPGDIREMQTRLERMVRVLELMAGKLSDDFLKALFIHNAIVKETEYVSTAPNRYNAFGCLVEGKAVCAGYAAAYQLVLNRLGIVCMVVDGYDRAKGPSGAHSWNLVQLGSDYYYIDVTWDDPTVRGSKEGTLTHHYFGLTEEELLCTHVIDGGQNLPKARGTRYNYYQYYGMYLPRYSFEAVSEIAARQLQKKDAFSVKFATPQETRRAEHDLLDNNRVFRIPGMSGSCSYGVSKSGLVLTVTKK